MFVKELSIHLRYFASVSLVGHSLHGRNDAASPLLPWHKVFQHGGAHAAALTILDGGRVPVELAGQYAVGNKAHVCCLFILANGSRLQEIQVVNAWR